MCYTYGWTHEYIMRRLTWNQFWLFVEHGSSIVSGQEVCYDDEEPLPLEGAFIRSDGARVVSK